VARTDDLFELPADLPVPVDDGACDHLPGMRVPPITLRSTSGRWVGVSELTGRTVVYCYPRTGEPDRDPPPGWNEIPGARGCTPQTCAFRDHHAEIRSLGAEVFGLSTQTTRYQREMVERLHVPFEVLSDADLLMARALRLPTFSAEGITLVKRLTLIVSDGVIEHVMYPVFPPDRNAADVIRWLEATRGGEETWPSRT
jgi:peroxiredoxin